MKWILIILGVLFFILGVFAFIVVRCDIQIIIGLIGVSAAFILWSIAAILDAICKLNKRLTILIGAENPKLVNPKSYKSQ